MARNKETDRRSTRNGPVPSAAEVPTTNNSDQQVALRAYEKWLARGCPIGDDLRDWFEAEQELRSVQEQSR